MTTRREFEMTAEDNKALLEACKPTPVMFLSGGQPMNNSPQENANEAWRKLGLKMGFDHMSVRPVSGKSTLFFTAEPAADPLIEDAAPTPFDNNSKDAFVVAERLGSGWAAVHYWWNTIENLLKPGEGFWEPWNTGVGRYATIEEADAEARDYAYSEQIRHRPQEPRKTA